MKLDSTYTNLKMKRKKNLAGLYGGYITAGQAYADSKTASTWLSPTKCTYHQIKMTGLHNSKAYEWETAMSYSPANTTVQGFGFADNYYNQVFYTQLATQTQTTATMQAFYGVDFAYGTATVQFNTANYVGTPETEEQRIDRELNQKRIAVAESRAEELLFMCIGEERKKQYIESGYFDVELDAHLHELGVNRLYRIHKGRSMNVCLMEKGKARFNYCIHPSDAVPNPDTMLAQFLMLTTNEKRFLEVANKRACGVFDGDVAYRIPAPVIPPGPDPLAVAEEQAFARTAAEADVALAA